MTRTDASAYWANGCCGRTMVGHGARKTWPARPRYRATAPAHVLVSHLGHLASTPAFALVYSHYDVYCSLYEHSQNGSCVPCSRCRQYIRCAGDKLVGGCTSLYPRILLVPPSLAPRFPAGGESCIVRHAHVPFTPPVSLASQPSDSQHLS